MGVAQLGSKSYISFSSEFYNYLYQFKVLEQLQTTADNTLYFYEPRGGERNMLAFHHHRTMNSNHSLNALLNYFEAVERNIAFLSINHDMFDSDEKFSGDNLYKVTLLTDEAKSNVMKDKMATDMTTVHDYPLLTAPNISIERRFVNEGFEEQSKINDKLKNFLEKYDRSNDYNGVLEKADEGLKIRFMRETKDEETRNIVPSQALPIQIDLCSYTIWKEHLKEYVKNVFVAKTPEQRYLAKRLLFSNAKTRANTIHTKQDFAKDHMGYDESYGGKAGKIIPNADGLKKGEFEILIRNKFFDQNNKQNDYEELTVFKENNTNILYFHFATQTEMNKVLSLSSTLYSEKNSGEDSYNYKMN
ncbi:hypothetical protein [Flammeovirga aprica]|uniref:Uncharacterized protein n=1 Tax=Flammeovirga aprica JL-4 TaxID=694437 RepID=A0A7X9RZL3_9BACT|nr:hypothetical protein [Flammeovirga aprica]NME71544.1 hypothetical protein [Flammeovirga aprica JL-4]